MPERDASWAAAVRGAFAAFPDLDAARAAAARLRALQGEQAAFAYCLVVLDLALAGDAWARKELPLRVDVLRAPARDPALAEALQGGLPELEGRWKRVRPLVAEFLRTHAKEPAPALAPAAPPPASSGPLRQEHPPALAPGAAPDAAATEPSAQAPLEPHRGPPAESLIEAPSEPSFELHVEVSGEVPAASVEPASGGQSAESRADPRSSLSGLPSGQAPVPPAGAPEPLAAPSAKPPPVPVPTPVPFAAPLARAEPPEVSGAAAPAAAPSIPAALTPPPGAEVEPIDLNGVDEDVEDERSPLPPASRDAPDDVHAFWLFTLEALGRVADGANRLGAPNAFAADTAAARNELKRFARELLARYPACAPARALASLTQLFLAGRQRAGLLRASRERRALVQSGLSLLGPVEPAAQAAVLFQSDGPKTREAFAAVVDLVLDYLGFCARHRLDPCEPRTPERYASEL